MSSLFVSYARNDETFARWLVKNLRNRGANVWLDVDSIPLAIKWQDAIQQALDSSQAMLVIISPDSMQSKNVGDEWQYYHSVNRPIIPILLKIPEAFPFQLMHIQRIDFSQEEQREESLHRLEDLLQKLGLIEVTKPNPTGSLSVMHCPHCGTDNYHAKPDSLCKKCGQALFASPAENTNSETTLMAPMDFKPLQVRASILRQYQMAGSFEFALQPGLEQTIGRHAARPPVEINLSPHGGDDLAVSRRHAALFFDGYSLYIRDLNSRNGTYINGLRAIAGRNVEVHDGDNVRLGAFQMSFSFKPAGN